MSSRQSSCAVVRSASILCLIFTSLLLILSGCRRNGASVIPQTPTGISYDEDIEAAVRDGRAPKIVAEAFSPHFASLSMPVAIIRRDGSLLEWEVFVATNRGVFGGPGDPLAEPGDRQAENDLVAHPSYGRCRVRLPDHRRGNEFSESAHKVNDKKVTDKKVTAVSKERTAASDDQPSVSVQANTISESDWIAGVSDQIGRSRTKDLMLFVHGFNVTFDAAVIRTAQVANDMPFNGAVCVWSWPSQGGASMSAYRRDETINKASVAPFVEFFSNLRAKLPAAARIHIVVHSMGNRIVMEGLKRLPLPEDRKPVHHLALCAPDVGNSDFRSLAAAAVEQCEHITLYASAGDVALKASQALHSEIRAGDASAPLLCDGIETIDCSDVEFSFLGHSYYGSNPNVLTDLYELLRENKTASARSHLAPRTSDGRTYWVFNRPASRIEADWQFEEE